MVKIGDVVWCPIHHGAPAFPDKATEWRIGILVEHNRRAAIYFPGEVEVLVGIDTLFFPPEWLRKSSIE